MDIVEVEKLKEGDKIQVSMDDNWYNGKVALDVKSDNDKIQVRLGFPYHSAFSYMVPFDRIRVPIE